MQYRLKAKKSAGFPNEPGRPEIGQHATAITISKTKSIAVAIKKKKKDDGDEK